MSKGLTYEDVTNAIGKLKKERWLSKEQAKAEEEEVEIKRLFNPSKRYQITIGISGFGTQNAHVIPINEFNHEDWKCPRCHQNMQDTIFYKNRRVFCQYCGLELWREGNNQIS